MITGQPIDRKDGRQKVTGTAQYAAEFAVPSVVHAVLVQSTVAAGQIAGFELRAAQGMPGVLAIITPDNALAMKKQGQVQQTVAAPLLQDKDIVYNGQHVAVVVADTLERAQAAAAAVKLRYKEGEAQTTMAGALDQAYVPKNFRNGERPPDSSRGDVKAAFDASPIRFEATYTTPVEHHNPMEPHATIAAWDGDRLTLWTATQGISGAQATLAALFGIDKANVRIISPFLGGGFGSKGNTWPPATLAAMASKIVGRPVKLVLSRAQMYTSNGYRPATVQKLGFGVAQDGTLQSVRHDGISQMSQPVLGEFVEPVALATEMLYACPNVAITHRLVAVNQGLPTYMRAPGEASGVFALESALDEIAAELKIDPIALRLKNYAEEDPSEKLPFSSKRLRECYAQGAASFGWDRRTPEPRSMRDGRYLVGLGMATATYPINQSPANVLVRLARQWGRGAAIRHAGYRHRHIYRHGTIGGRRARPADRARAVRTGRQPLPAGTRVRWFADGGKRRLRRAAGVPAGAGPCCRDGDLRCWLAGCEPGRLQPEGRRRGGSERPHHGRRDAGPPQRGQYRGHRRGKGPPLRKRTRRRIRYTPSAPSSPKSA